MKASHTDDPRGDGSCSGDNQGPELKPPPPLSSTSLCEEWMIFDVARLLHELKARMLAVTAGRKSSSRDAGHIVRLGMSAIMGDAIDPGCRHRVPGFIFRCHRCNTLPGFIFPAQTIHLLITGGSVHLQLVECLSVKPDQWVLALSSPELLAILPSKFSRPTSVCVSHSSHVGTSFRVQFLRLCFCFRLGVENEARPLSPFCDDFPFAIAPTLYKIVFASCHTRLARVM